MKRILLYKATNSSMYQYLGEIREEYSIPAASYEGEFVVFTVVNDKVVDFIYYELIDSDGKIYKHLAGSYFLLKEHIDLIDEIKSLKDGLL